MPYGLPNGLKVRLGLPSCSTVPSLGKPIRQYGWDAIGSCLRGLCRAPPTTGRRWLFFTWDWRAPEKNEHAVTKMILVFAAVGFALAVSDAAIGLNPRPQSIVIDHSGSLAVWSKGRLHAQPCFTL